MADEEKSPVVLLEPRVHSASEMQYLSVDVPTVYSNNALIKFTNWDVGLLFGELISQGIGEHETLAVRPRVRVMMSHAHLKAFAQALTETVEAFEGSMGKITIINPADAVPADAQET